MYWTFVVAVVLTVLGAALTLLGGVDGDIRTIGLWVVIVGGLGTLLTLLLAPRRLQWHSRDET